MYTAITKLRGFATASARPLAWCFASFGISDAYPTFNFSFPHGFSTELLLRWHSGGGSIGEGGVKKGNDLQVVPVII